MPNDTPSSMPTSGIFVLLSTTVAGMIGKLALPWTAYQVLVWTQSHPGILFPAGYPELLAEIATVIFQIIIGVGHILVIAAYRNWPPEGMFSRFFSRRSSAPVGLSAWREPYDLSKQPPTPPAA